MLYIIIIISSGLFLGWLLGSKDTANLFGTSVSSKRMNFQKASVIAGIFIVLGAIFQGKGTTSTIHSLGNIYEPVIAFTVVLCAAIIVLVLVKVKLPVSTSQAIVGAILGWSLFTYNSINITIASKILLAWILAPVLGIIIGALLFIGMRWFIKKSNIHVIKLDAYLRFSLIIVIAFAAFGLGANNIGNVIGVFSEYAPDVIVNFGLFTINGLQVLFLLGGISIAGGLFYYSRRSLHDTDEGVFSLIPETAIIVHLTLGIVLFIFSSSFMSNLIETIGMPSIPLVPVSSTQIILGAILGIGLVKGTWEIDSKTIAGIGLSWITTPLSAGLLTYMVLAIFRKTFGFPLENKPEAVVETLKSSGHSSIINLVVPGIIILGAVILLVFAYLIFRQQKLRLKIEKDMLIQQNQLYMSQKAMNDLEVRTIAMENDNLNVKLQAKRKEFMDIALNINEQKNFLEKISNGIDDAILMSDHDERIQKLKDLSVMLKQRMSFSKEKKEFYMQIEDVHKDFHMKLKTTFPNLTDLEKRLAGLIRLDLSTKEMASLLNISAKSVEIARYRLKKKLNLDKNSNLKNFINNI